MEKKKTNLAWAVIRKADGELYDIFLRKEDAKDYIREKWHKGYMRVARREVTEITK